MAEEFLPAAGGLGAGTQIASYRLGEQVGWGGMAAVYRARDVRLDRWVAVKILAPEVTEDESFRQRFAFESKAAAAVDHPNIIPVFDAGESGGMLYIAMRYVAGGDVRTLLHESGRLGVAQVAATIAQVASALDAAHEAGLVHRDVKPANILLAGSGGTHPDHVYLTDFGLSRTATAVTSPGLMGRVAGTLDYMAPEQIEGRRVDGRADQYGLACVAYEMLAGEAPFHRGQDLRLLRQQFAEAPLPLTSLRPDLPPEIDQVLARALARSPDDRYATCLDFAASLVRACGLEWGVIGQLLPGSPQPTVLAAPLASVVPAVRRPVEERGQLTGDGWSPAPPLLAAQAMTVAPVKGRDRQAALTAALTGRETDRGGPGRPDWPARPARPARRAGGRRSSPPPSWSSCSPWRAGPISSSGATGPRPATRPAPPPRRPPTTPVAPPGQAAVAPARRARTLRASPAPGPGPVLVRMPAQAPAPVPAPPPAAAPSPRPAARPLSPAGTVRAYITAINHHHYRRAWHLRGRAGVTTYAAFRQGFSTTSQDALFVLGVSGDVVSVRLDAQQTDGSVKTYQGTYTVQDGVITAANIRQIG